MSDGAITAAGTGRVAMSSRHRRSFEILSSSAATEIPPLARLLEACPLALARSARGTFTIACSRHVHRHLPEACPRRLPTQVKTIEMRRDRGGARTTRRGKPTCAATFAIKRQLGPNDFCLSVRPATLSQKQ